jgi:hypothetical protein
VLVAGSAEAARVEVHPGATDFGSANYSGAPPQDLVSRAGKLVGTVDVATLAAHDFNAVARWPGLDVGRIAQITRAVIRSRQPTSYDPQSC